MDGFFFQTGIATTTMIMLIVVTILLPIPMIVVTGLPPIPAPTRLEILKIKRVNNRKVSLLICTNPLKLDVPLTHQIFTTKRVETGLR
jgi:hypothetical protein